MPLPPDTSARPRPRRRADRRRPGRARRTTTLAAHRQRARRHPRPLRAARSPRHGLRAVVPPAQHRMAARHRGVRRGPAGRLRAPRHGHAHAPRPARRRPPRGEHPVSRPGRGGHLPALRLARCPRTPPRRHRTADPHRPHRGRLPLPDRHRHGRPAGPLRPLADGAPRQPRAAAGNRRLGRAATPGLEATGRGARPPGGRRALGLPRHRPPRRHRRTQGHRTELRELQLPPHHGRGTATGRPVPSVVLVSCADGTDGVDAVRAEAQRCLALVQEWLTDDRLAGSRLVFITQGAQSCGPDEDIAGLAASVVWGSSAAARPSSPDASDWSTSTRRTAHGAPCCPPFPPSPTRTRRIPNWPSATAASCNCGSSAPGPATPAPRHAAPPVPTAPS